MLLSNLLLLETLAPWESHLLFLDTAGLDQNIGISWNLGSGGAIALGIVTILGSGFSSVVEHNL